MKSGRRFGRRRIFDLSNFWKKYFFFEKSLFRNADKCRSAGRIYFIFFVKRAHYDATHQQTVSFPFTQFDNAYRYHIHRYHSILCHHHCEGVSIIILHICIKCLVSSERNLHQWLVPHVGRCVVSANIFVHLRDGKLILL